MRIPLHKTILDPKLSQVDVVRALMRTFREEHQKILARNSNRKKVHYMVAKCLREDSCAEGGEFYFAKGTDFWNTCGHLKRCLVGNNKVEIIVLSQKTMDERKKNGIFNNENNIISMKLNQIENEIHAY